MFINESSFICLFICQAKWLSVSYITLGNGEGWDNGADILLRNTILFRQLLKKGLSKESIWWVLHKWNHSHTPSDSFILIQYEVGFITDINQTKETLNVCQKSYLHFNGFVDQIGKCAGSDWFNSETAKCGYSTCTLLYNHTYAIIWNVVFK